QFVDINPVGNDAAGVAISDEIVIVRSAVKHGSNKMPAHSMFERTRPNNRCRGHNRRRYSTDAQARTHNPTRAIQTGNRRAQRRASQRWEYESKWRRAAGALDKDWRRRRIRVKRGIDQAGRVSAEFFLNVCRREPIGKQSTSTAEHPSSSPRDIPGSPNTRTSS